MTKSEPFCPYGILSLALYVDKVLIYDTGSEDKFLEDLFSTQKIFSNIEIVQRKLEDAHSWVASNLDTTVNNNVAKALGDIRREMQTESDSEFIWVLDGDEIYPNLLASKVRSYVDKGMGDKNAFFLPFIDFCHDFKNLRQIHTMGRVFRNKAVELRGSYPAEMHYDIKGNYCLESNSPDSVTLKYESDNNSVFHFESLVKPWRKPLNILRKFEGRLPEVFDKYPQFKKNIERWS